MLMSSPARTPVSTRTPSPLWNNTSCSVPIAGKNPRAGSSAYTRARVYAEDPARGFLPAIGTLQEVLFHNGEGVRVDTGVRAGDDISIHYDPMIAKVIAHAGDRNAAIGRLSHALALSHIAGPRNVR